MSLNNPARESISKALTSFTKNKTKHAFDNTCPLSLFVGFPVVGIITVEDNKHDWSAK